MSMPGMEMLRGAIDSHVHCCPHINGRTVTVFEAVREAAKAGLAGIGLLDVFANTSGLAALAMRELDELGVEVFGGIILEPYVGGLSTRVVETALDMGYGPGTGARFISLPCHHTQFVARSEGRSPVFVETCLAIPAKGALPDPLGEIMERVADRDVVFNTGHLTGEETIRVVEEAAKRGVRRILCPASYFTTDEAREIVGLGAFVEFAFFVMSHATQVGTTMIDSEKHCFPPVTLDTVVEKIRAVGPEHTVLSSDSGSFILPPPVEALREWLLMIESEGFSRDDIRRMVAENPAMLFKVGAMAAEPPPAG
ncbi:MAG: DUF6282 family protein [Rhodospirillales bacterium]|jgi:hypothetical protein|nr:DUF6282 family protein [Rhodospirillales bacterium]MDP6882594.1 DUF6282 family protein [Rhodospirillales bacterium]